MKFSTNNCFSVSSCNKLTLRHKCHALSQDKTANFADNEMFLYSGEYYVLPDK